MSFSASISLNESSSIFEDVIHSTRVYEGKLYL